jgi:hypothetical protein
MNEAIVIRRLWNNGSLGGGHWLDSRRFNDDIGASLIRGVLGLFERGWTLLLLAFRLGRV